VSQRPGSSYPFLGEELCIPHPYFPAGIGWVSALQRTLLLTPCLGGLALKMWISNVSRAGGVCLILVKDAPQSLHCPSRQHTCRWPWLSSVLLPPLPAPPAALASGPASWLPSPSPPHASGVSCSQLLAFPTSPSLHYYRITVEIWEPRIKHPSLRNTLHMYIYCCKMFCMALTSRFSQTVCAHRVSPHPSCQ